MRFNPQSGLTLIELMAVLLIVSLGWFTLLPRLDPAGPSAARDKPLPEMNELLAEAAKAALATGRFQEVLLDRRTGFIEWGDTRVSLPSAVAECRINDQPCPPHEAHLRVYAHGFMDRLVLTLFSGESWISADLTARMIQPELQRRL